ncbi:SusC/RagA family TonB-linked outer membrane protein [Parabacteroides sp. Marseille-P3160]|uniref:SusC/RagA family TonB-linked outer membrane protein n=1 Tax=Parabacteroides sp. Marseille-P3160 TaxID=1917887 RepID=UPI0009B97F52
MKDGSYYYIGHYNWVDRLISKAIPKQNHNISVSGGSGKTTFYSSFGFSKQNGPLKIRPDIYERKNARLTVENNTYDWMTLGLKISYNTKTYDQQHTYKDNLYHAIVFSSPTRGGEWGGDPDYPQYDKYVGYFFEDQSPLGYLTEGSRDKIKANEVVLSPSLDLRPLKNWNIHLDFTYNRLSENTTTLATKIDKFLTNKFIETYGNSTSDFYQVDKSDQEYMSFNAFTDYSFSLNEKHNFKALLGFNQEVTKYGITSGKLETLLSGDIPSLSLGTGTKTVSSNAYDWALRGGFFRLNYDFEGKYLLEGNLRYDGTSRFPKDDRFVLLPSFSIGWRVSEENFMKFTKPLFDNIKLRASYGNLGNQLLTSSSWSGNTKYYPYIPLMSNGLTSNYMLSSSAVAYVDPYALTPASLTWEKVSTINGGLDLTLLNNRFDFSFDIYNRTTKDMLFSQDVPSLLGASAPVKNSGELQTKGWEITASWNDKIGDDFNYRIGLSLFDSQAKITKFEGGNRSISGYYEGKEIGEIWGFETVGFFTSAEDVANSPSQSAINSGTWTAGDIKYADLDKSGSITKGASTVEDHGDLKVIGNTTPRYNFGINLNGNYKGFYTTLFFQGVGKRDFWPSAQAFWPVSTQYFNTQKWFITDSWSETNTDAYFPIPRARNTKNQQSQTKYLQDASYIRLKNFTVGYVLPSNIVKKVKLSNVNLYFSAENMWEHSGVKGAYDPEGMANAGAMYYPLERTYSIGIDLTF